LFYLSVEVEFVQRTIDQNIAWQLINFLGKLFIVELGGNFQQAICITLLIADAGSKISCASNGLELYCKI
jgi:hypothetical protein